MYGREESLPRARAPPPGAHLDAPPRRRRRPHRARSRPASCSTAAPTRRRRRRSWSTPSRTPRARTACANAVVDGCGGAHEQPAVRRHARLRRGAGVLRPRGPDGPARGARAASTRSRSGCATPWRTATGCITGQVVDERRSRCAACIEATAPPCRCPPTRDARRRLCAGRAAPAARPTPTTSGAASAARSASRTSCTPRASTTSRRRAAACRTARPAQLRRRRGRPGVRHHRPADRPHDPRRRRRRARRRRTRRSAPRGRRRPAARRGCRAAPSTPPCRAVRERLFEHVGRRARRRPGRAWPSTGTDVVDTDGRAARAGGRGDRRASGSRRPSSSATGPPKPLDDDGQGNCHTAVRLRRPPGRRRRRPRARPGEGGAGRHRAGRRPGAQPAVGAGPDRGRHRPGPRAWR